jgi:hypothetical protein
MEIRNNEHPLSCCATAARERLIPTEASSLRFTGREQRGPEEAESERDIPVGKREANANDPREIMGLHSEA